MWPAKSIRLKRPDSTISFMRRRRRYISRAMIHTFHTARSQTLVASSFNSLVSKLLKASLLFSSSSSTCYFSFLKVASRRIIYFHRLYIVCIRNGSSIFLRRSVGRTHAFWIFLYELAINSHTVDVVVTSCTVVVYACSLCSLDLNRWEQKNNEKKRFQR